MASTEQLPFVEAEVNYLGATHERPRYYAYDRDPSDPPAVMPLEPHRVQIRSLRPISDELSLDAQGFALAEHRSAVRDFWDDDEVRRVYYPEAEEVIAAATGGARVFIFDHLQRRRVPGLADRSRGGPRQPAGRVHVDHTARSGPQRVRDLMGDEAEELLRGRVQVINLWRPILSEPLRDAPLAVCDSRTVDNADLVPSDLVYRDRTGETYSVSYNPAHRWYYVPEMRRDEGLLLKIADTRTDIPARFMPHTSFTDPTTPPGAAPRESIEIRSLVFHPA
ncbi:MAG TPA: CmcJ/NvfI family oxidoreductase [Stellaceae bacterium]|nr:CmcJ/NvfI family oxidoreductase [Stellaceae bacterium]